MMIKVGTVVWCGGNKSGWGIRVQSLLCMLSTFSDVRLIYTEPEASYDDSLVTAMQGRIENLRVAAPETGKSRLTRIFNNYRSDESTVGDEVATKAREGLDAIQVEALDLLFLGKRLSKGKIPLILDQHNVYWELNQYSIFDSPLFRTQVGQMRAVRGVLGPWLRSRATAFELSAMKKAQHVLFTSERDASLAKKRLPQISERVTVIPNCIDVKRYSPGTPRTDGLPKVLFVGKLDYSPNREAAVNICQKLAPHFIGKAEFIIAGAPIPKIDNVPGNVRFLGWVEDVRPLMTDATVCIVPLRHGSGTRIKILEYMASGRPIVATSKGCEGLEVNHEEDIIVADTDEDFVSAIGVLLKDETMAKRLSESAYRLVQEKYDWRAHSHRLKVAYESIGLKP
jgi:glycosyltransferase involved in cell wall biosynthesis